MTLDPSLLLVLHAVATCGMAGVIWFVQVVHYPAYRDVGAAEFPRYQTHHQRHTTWVVAPLMFAELGTAGWLVWQPPPGVAAGWCWVGAFLVGVNWASTAFIQVPLHTRLSAGRDAATIERLIRSNWLRTAAWSLRAVLAAGLLLVQR